MVSPINWVITGFTTWSTGLHFMLMVKTDVMVYLECFWTYDNPDVELIPAYQRGERTWCVAKKTAPMWHRAFQSEWADSIYHTFTLPMNCLWKKHYLRFEGTFLGTPTISNSPIFPKLERTYWEPWEGSIGLYHPWQITYALPGCFAALVDHHLLMSLPGRWAGDSLQLETILGNDPTNPEYMMLPRFMDTTNAIPFSGHYFIAYISFIIRGPGYVMELTCVVATPFPAVFPYTTPNGRYILIGTGRTLTSLRTQLTIWLNYNHRPPNPELAHIYRVTIYLSNQPWPHPHPSALHQEYLDLIEELPE